MKLYAIIAYRIHCHRDEPFETDDFEFIIGEPAKDKGIDEICRDILNDYDVRRFPKDIFQDPIVPVAYIEFKDYSSIENAFNEIIKQAYIELNDGRFENLISRDWDMGSKGNLYKMKDGYTFFNLYDIKVHLDDLRSILEETLENGKKWTLINDPDRRIRDWNNNIT